MAASPSRVHCPRFKTKVNFYSVRVSIQLVADFECGVLNKLIRTPITSIRMVLTIVAWLLGIPLSFANICL